MKNIAVGGAGIVGICSAYFLQKAGFQVTLIDKEEPGTMTSYGHACTFADYACIPVNSPDLFREMDYLWKVSMALHKKRIDPKIILKMATVNAGKLLNQKIGVIKQGFLADCIFLEKKSIDLDPLNNPHAAVVHRASENSIKAVMIGGEFVHGKI